MEDKAAVGGRPVVLRCSECGHELKIVDPEVTEYGPIRCGACGSEVQISHLRRIVQQTMPGES